MRNLRHTLGRRRPRRPPPINAFPKHRQLRRGQVDDTLGGRRPRKAAALQNLVVEAKSLLVPVKQLHPVAPAATKGENRARARILDARTCSAAAAKPWHIVTPLATCRCRGRSRGRLHGHDQARDLARSHRRHMKRPATTQADRNRHGKRTRRRLLRNRVARDITPLRRRRTPRPAENSPPPCRLLQNVPAERHDAIDKFETGSNHGGARHPRPKTLARQPHAGS